MAALQAVLPAEIISTFPAFTTILRFASMRGALSMGVSTGGTWMLKTADFMFLTLSAMSENFLARTSSSASLGLFQGVRLVVPKVIISCSPSISTTLSSGFTT